MHIHISQVEEWATIIKEAKEIAQAASTDDDGGTSNLDQPVIELPRWTKKQVEVLKSKVPGVIGTKLEGTYWKGCYFMHFDLKGQGNNRTRMAKAAYEHMKEKGMPVRFYQQMD